MWHGRGMVHDVELGLKRDGTITGLQGLHERGGRRLRGDRRVPAVLHADDGGERLRRAEGRVQLAGGHHQHHAGRRVPRRGPARGDPHDGAHPRHRGRRARHRPGRDPAQELHPARRVPVHAEHRPRRHVRHGRVRQGARRRARARRLRRAARRAEGAPRPRRPRAHGHRRRVVPRDQRADGAHAGVRLGRDRRRRHGHRARRHRARTGRVTRPRSRRSSRRRSACRSRTCACSTPTPTRCRAAAAPAGRARARSAAARCSSRARRCSRRRSASPRTCSKPTPTTSSLGDDGLEVAGVPASKLAWADLAAAAKDPAQAARGCRRAAAARARLPGRRFVVPVRLAHRRSSRSTPRPAASSSCATSRSTTAARSSTR